MEAAKKRIIVLGTGFGAVRFVRGIDRKLFDVTIVSPRNYFLFTPLLASTTVGTIEFRSIIEPIRTSRSSMEYYQASCLGIDEGNHRIHCESSPDGTAFDLEYDILIIAVGAGNNTYGVPGVEEHAIFLKDLPDARAIRTRIVACFEQAGVPGIPEEHKGALLHFVVVGGGPTGIEFAAELHDFLTEDLRKKFPTLTKLARITVLEASPSILSSFGESLSNYTMRIFKRANIEVNTDTLVTEVVDGGVLLKNGVRLSCGLIVWSAGIAPVPLLETTSFEKDKAGWLVVDEFLHVLGREDIYALGDCTVIAERSLPRTAQLAQQQGKYLAKALNRKSKGRAIDTFYYRHLGMLAYIGQGKALADLPGVKWGGFFAWVMWRSIYITKLVSLKNKVLVLFDWIKAALFGRDVSRF